MHVVIDQPRHDHSTFKVHHISLRTDERANRCTTADGQILAISDRETLDPWLRRILRIDGTVNEHSIGDRSRRSGCNPEAKAGQERASEQMPAAAIHFTSSPASSAPIFQ